MPYYHTAEPSSYLVITGLNIDGIRIRKKAMVWPFQKVTKISITPFDFSMTLQAMTIEKLKFSLPAVFTIGPHDNLESLRKYATLLTGSDGQAGQKQAVGTGRGHVQDIVKGIIEGETRSIVSTMTMEELFRERTIFKKKVIESVQSELESFGLHIYNANVKELQDTPGSEYFSYLSQKAHEGALNQARIDVASARARGEIGEAEKQSQAKQEIARIDATTAVLQTERKSEQLIADSKLKEKKIHAENGLELERIAARRAEEARDAELQKDVEIKRAHMELEKQRASTVVAAKIARESAEEKAQASLYSKQRDADAQKYQKEKEAEAYYARQARETDAKNYDAIQMGEAHAVARQKEADATLYTRKAEAEAFYTRQARETDAKNYDATQLAEAHAIARKKEADAALYTRQAEADAALYSRQAEAKGISEIARAYGDLAKSLGGPQGLMQYLMMQDGLHVKLANANAAAIKGLQPKINIWTQDGNSAAEPISSIFKTLPPLFSTIADQTGMGPPSWLMSTNNQQTADAQALMTQKAMVNGTKA